MIRKRREDYLAYHINETIDQKFRMFNEYQLRPFVESGAPVFLKPIHVDNFDLQKKFMEAEIIEQGPAEPEEKDKKKRRKKRRKKK